MKTSAERKRKERENKRAAGLFKIEIWANRAQLKLIKEYSEKVIGK